MSSQVPPSVDPVSIWLRSQIIDSPNPKQERSVHKRNVAERYSGQRSALWSSLSEMTGPNRNELITKLIKNWPIAKERHAFVNPVHLGYVTVSCTATYMAYKITADLIFFNPKAGFIKTIKATKSPIIFPLYTSGFCFFGFYQISVMKPILGENPPSPLNLLLRMSAIFIGSGVLFPVVTTPFLAHYVNMQRNPKMPVTKNMLEFFTLTFMASKPTWRYIPYLTLFHFGVASLCTYSLFWSRERIFDSLELEPEFISDVLMSSKDSKSPKSFLNKIFARFTILHPFVDDPTLIEPDNAQR